MDPSFQDQPAIGAKSRAPTIGATIARAGRDTMEQLGWPRGPLLALGGFGVFALLAVLFSERLGVNPLAAMGLCAGALAILAAAVFVINLALAGYRMAVERAEAAEDALQSLLQHAHSLDGEQIERIVARYYGSAHTFVSFHVASRVSVSQNVESVEMPDGNTMVIRFLQALEPRSILVRPVGGTPRVDIVSSNSRSITLRLALPTDIVRLRIFGDIVPQLRNHGPEPDPLASAARIAARHRAGAPTLLRDVLREDITT